MTRVQAAYALLSMTLACAGREADCGVCVIVVPLLRRLGHVHLGVARLQAQRLRAGPEGALPAVRGLHSCTSLLNLSRF